MEEKMNNLVTNMLDFYNKAINIGELKQENITVPNQFIKNEKFIRRKYLESIDEYFEEECRSEIYRELK